MIFIGWLVKYLVEFQIQMTLGSGIYVGWVGAATAIFVSVLYFMGMYFNCIFSLFRIDRKDIVTLKDIIHDS